MANITPSLLQANIESKTTEAKNQINIEKIQELTSEQAYLILAIIDGTEFHFTLPYVIKREKPNLSGDVSWANEYIEYHYYVQYMGTEKTEIKFYDWVLQSKDLIKAKAQLTN